MRLIDAIRGKRFERRSETLTLDEYAKLLSEATPFGLGERRTLLGEKEEEPLNTFEGYVQSAYKRNGVVFACCLARQLHFSEARFQFQRRMLGRPGVLFGTEALKPIEEPWPGGSTRDLTNRAMQDVDMGGNWFGTRRRGGRIMRLRPDWVTIILGSPYDADVGFGDADAEVLGYIYSPGGPNSNEDPVPFLREEVAHWAPIPDPVAAYRGMSWIQPIVREIMGDGAASNHKLKFFENGATPNMVVSLDAKIPREEYEAWMKLFEEKSGGTSNAYKTLYLGAGAKAEQIGVDLKSVDFKAVQGAGETRIAAAAGVPPVIVGLSEGLAAATYSNYGQARRRFADLTMRPLWGGFAEALATIIDLPPGAELWYDERDISFLQEDRADEAEIRVKDSTTAKQLIEAGFEPDSVVAAIESNDMTKLSHTGLVSVQLQEPGQQVPGSSASE